MTVLSPTELAYLAGIIDGEGCISFQVRKGRYVTPTIQITNTDRRLTDWLLDHVDGGSVYRRPGYKQNHKPTYLWRCAGRIARDVLGDVRPFLLIKAEQADVVMSLERVTEIRRDDAGRLRTTLTDEQIEANLAAVARIRDLNRRGVPQ